MSVIIKLDRPTLAALIEGDPEFKFELTNAVVSEVLRKYFVKDATKIIEAAEPALFKKALAAVHEEGEMLGALQKLLDVTLAEQSYHSSVATPSAKTTLMLGEAKTQALARIQSDLMLSALAKAEEVLPAILDSLDERIEKRLTRLVDEGIEKLVRDKVQARLAAVAAAVS